MSPKYKYKTKQKTTKSTDSSIIRHTNHSDDKTTVTSNNFIKKYMVTVTCNNSMEA